MTLKNQRFVIFSGFWQDHPGGKTLEISPDDFIACADGGWLACFSMGFNADVVIGDCDSLSAEHISEIKEQGIKMVVHPREKDDTDTMLCAKYGLAHGYDRFLIIGGIGGDFGHTIANLQVLSFLTDKGCEAEIMTGRERILMIAGGLAASDPGVSDAAGACIIEEGERDADSRIAKNQRFTNEKDRLPGASDPGAMVFSGQPGGRFSVLSYGGQSTGVCIENAKYPLTNAALTHSNPIGVGNEFINTSRVKVSVQSGRLLVIIDMLG